MIVSGRSIDSILDRQSTLETQNRSTDIQGLEKEPMTVMALGDSTGRRMMNMESTEMIMDMLEIEMDTSFMYPRMTSEVFWKETQWMSTTTYLFQNMLGHSHKPS